MNRTCTGENQGILGVVPGHARIVPNARPQAVIAGIAELLKQLCPVRGPLFVDMTSTTLPRDSGGKYHNIRGVAQALHKNSRRRGRQVFGYFERKREVESTIKFQWRGKVVLDELLWGNCQLCFDPWAINAKNYPHPELVSDCQPIAGAAADIDYACRFNEVEDERQNLAGRLLGGCQLAIKLRIVVFALISAHCKSARTKSAANYKCAQRQSHLPPGSRVSTMMVYPAIYDSFSSS